MGVSLNSSYLKISEKYNKERSVYNAKKTTDLYRYCVIYVGRLYEKDNPTAPPTHNTKSDA